MSNSNGTGEEIRLKISYRKRLFIHYALLTAIILSAGYLRFHQLGKPDIWTDEHLMFHSANYPVDKIILQKWVLDKDASETPDPPLAIVISRLFMKLGGAEKDKFNKQFTELSPKTRCLFRLQAALAGFFSVLAIYMLATMLIDRRAGLICAFLTTFLFHSAYFSREGRPYSLAFFLAVTAAWAFLAFLKKQSFLNGVLFAVSLTASLYNSYFGMLMAVTACVWVAAFFIRFLILKQWAEARSFILKSTLALLFVLILYFPWIPTLMEALLQIKLGVPEIPPQGFVASIEPLSPFFWELLLRWSTGDVLRSFVFLLTSISIIWIIIKENKTALIVLPWLFLPWIIVPLIPGSMDIQYRHLFYSYPALILLIGAGINALFALEHKAMMSLKWGIAIGVALVLSLALLIGPSLPHLNVLFGESAKCAGVYYTGTRPEHCKIFIFR